MTATLAAIPYTTFPEINLGPLTLRTFGLFVAIGVVVGAWFAARFAEEHGIPRDQTYRMATMMVLGGLIASRLTWVATHPEQIDTLIDVIAVWEGGLQFAGGFIGAFVVAYPTLRRWPRQLRWRSLDSYAYGLTIGLAIGRIACYSVGEHFGGQSDWPIAVRYEGGALRETTLGGIPIVEGMTFHNTALYEWASLLVLFGIMTWLRYGRRSRYRAGTLVGLFCAWYGVSRFATDILRVNDERVFGLTGAQWMCLALVPIAAWVLLRVRDMLDREAAAEGRLAIAGAPDELEAPD